MDKLKLNIFQKGFTSKAFVLCVYFLLFVLAAYIIDIIDQSIFLNTLQLAVDKEIISKEIFLKLKIYINTRNSLVVLPMFFVGAICTLVGWFFMRWVASYNIAWSVTLPEAMEFRPAMKKLGILSLSEEISFITKHKIQIFIAKTPFLMEEARNIRARLYPFSSNDILVVQSVFEKAIGARKLCITKEAYSYLLEKSEKITSLQASSSLMEKDKEIEVCNTRITTLSKEIEELKGENTLLQAENTNFKNKQKTEVGREKVEINRARRQRIQWIAINTLLDRIIEESPANKIYTEQEFKDLLDKEWQDSQHLQDEMEKLCKKRELKFSQTMLNAAKGCLADAGRCWICCTGCTD